MYVFMLLIFTVGLLIFSNHVSLMLKTLLHRIHYGVGYCRTYIFMECLKLHKYFLFSEQLFTLRGSVLEDAIPNLKSSNSNKTLNTKEVLEYVAPEMQLSW